MRTRSGVLAVALPLAAALLASACSSSSPSSSAAGGTSAAAAASTAKIIAIGAENEYADVIGQIGGKYVNVSAIMSNPNTDPHTFEASPAVAREVSAAQLVVQNGVGYDTFMNTIESADPNGSRKVIDVQTLLGLPDSTPNPHLWYKPVTMPVVANAVAADLGQLDPAQASYFKANAASFIASLTAWNNAIAAFKSAHPNVPVATTEPVADYMLQAVGADNMTPFTFLYLGTQTSSTTGASFTILFGSMFVISPDTVPALIASGLLALVVVAVLSRVLLLTALSPEIAAAHGVRVRAVGVAYLAALAVAVALSAVVIGAVLSTALLIGPAATSLRVTKRPGLAMAAAALAGTAATWLGILLAYDSYYWTSGGRGLPVSFFVVALVVLGYLLSYARLPRSWRPGRGQAARAPENQEAPECSPA